ncbi:hypothetical protein PtA15_2A136 [Puccinia triticina]|uniref:Condensin complex subunit 1 n=1 Tax=Puccinia triticina TaxID=208348 RepID=A0ABY7C9J6_9BASI|nr:uncharacterized protein PtA15_2A136 [Puccinia triticina]WAQ81824.1 hypothetical protein PtA15_2A136 [Puccinia triticina]
MAAWTLADIVDSLTRNPHHISQPEIFHSSLNILRNPLSIPTATLHSLLDLLPSAFEALLTATLRDANPADHTAYSAHRPHLERFAFLLQALVEACEKRRTTAEPTSNRPTQRKQQQNTTFDWAPHIPDLLNALLKALALKTEFIWPTSQDRDAFIGCFTKPVYQILEIKPFADSLPIRIPAFKIICTAAKSHGQIYSTQTSILQKLQYFDHLSEYMAELTHLLVESKDLPQLADAILREISTKTFSAQDNKGPRSFSRYLVKLTTLAPRLVFRQIVILQKHLDSESYVMRICLLEIFDDHPDNQLGGAAGGRDKENQSQGVKLDGFFNLLFDRFCDSNTFVRVKVVNIFEDILKLSVPFPKHRLRLAAMALRSLEDKSSQVRKHCMTVLSRLIETHPYGVMHGGELEIGEWQARYDEIVKELSVLDLPANNGVDEERPAKKNKTPRTSQAAAEMDVAAVDQQQAALSTYDSQELMKLRLTKKYYADAIQFIHILHNAVPAIEKLLASKVAGNVEDDIADVVFHAREKELLFGKQSILAVFAPMTVQICGLPAVYKNETLQTAAALSLGKFMCVSGEFCEKHLMLLFKILETSQNPAVRSNIIIALGDIAVCFATIMDQHSDGLYKGLADPDLDVKKNTLMVLTHLILNGMIKVKGQLGEIAKCINDPEKRISELAQLFFDELSKKDQNAIYNNLPDMISHLSVGKHAVDAPLFRSVMDNIFKHLKKDKQSEAIVEKLCQRFRLVGELRQWQDIAYCLALLQFKSEKALKKLVDGLPSYQDKLYDPEVFKSFEDILTKVKANKWAKEHGDLVEFEKALRAQKEKGEEDQLMERKVHKKQAVVRKRRQKQAVAPPPSRKPSRPQPGPLAPHAKVVAGIGETRRRRRTTKVASAARSACPTPHRPGRPRFPTLVVVIQPRAAFLCVLLPARPAPRLGKVPADVGPGDGAVYIIGPPLGPLERGFERAGRALPVDAPDAPGRPSVGPA